MAKTQFTRPVRWLAGLIALGAASTAVGTAAAPAWERMRAEDQAREAAAARAPKTPKPTDAPKPTKPTLTYDEKRIDELDNTSCEGRVVEQPRMP